MSWPSYQKSIMLCIFLRVLLALGLDFYLSSSENSSGSNVVKFINTGPGLLSASSPLTMYENLEECVWLYERGLDPYGMGQVRVSPLYLLFSFLLFASLKSKLLSTAYGIILWTIPDALSAWFLVRIWKARTALTESSPIAPSKLSKSPSESPKSSSKPSSLMSSDTLLPAIYLLSPFQILPSMARSTSIFDNMILLASIAYACEASANLEPKPVSIQDGSSPTAANATVSADSRNSKSNQTDLGRSRAKSLLLLAFRVHLSLDTLILIPPVVMLILSEPRSRLKEPGPFAAREDQNHILRSILSVLSEFMLYWTVLTFVSTLIVGHWGWMNATWGASLTLPSLTPNPGLWWYFFTEMFDHFRPFFLVVFEVHLLMYVAPICIKFQHDPLYAIFLLVGILATFKPYPTLSDHGLFIVFYAIFEEVYPYLRHPFPTVLVLLHSSLLQPLFAHLWLTHGTGNANFYYASTLVGACAGGMGTVDAMWAGLRVAMDRHERGDIVRDEGEEKEVVTQL